MGHIAQRGQAVCVTHAGQPDGVFVCLDPADVYVLNSALWMSGAGRPPA